MSILKQHVDYTRQSQRIEKFGVHFHEDSASVIHRQAVPLPAADFPRTLTTLSQ